MSTKKTPHQLRDFDFNEAELDLRTLTAISNYSTSVDGTRDPFTRELIRGALVLVQADYLTPGIQKVIDLTAQGYVLDAAMGCHYSGTYPDTFFTAHMIKPEAVQEAEKVAISAKVAEQYATERKAKYDAHVLAVAAESVQRLERAAAKEAEAARAKALAAATKEAVDAIGAFA